MKPFLAQKKTIKIKEEKAEIQKKILSEKKENSMKIIDQSMTDISFNKGKKQRK